MPEGRSRSASPKRRSASPPRKRSRSPPRKPRGTSGFKWKKPAAAQDDDQPRRDFQDSYRPRRYDNDRRRDDGDRRRDDRRRDDRAPDRNPERGSRYGDARRDGPRGDRSDERAEGRRDRDAPRADKDGKKAAPKPKAQTRPPPTPATFIIVTVNDRLGTKASIPCLPSDTVGEFGSPHPRRYANSPGDFKKLVAAQIGRQPHEIMLKRQSERPFKDAITLADYGINNGVQIDLELNTGD
jgi:hypothetical protein